MRAGTSDASLAVSFLVTLCPVTHHIERLFSEPKRGAAWILPAAGRTWVMLAGHHQLGCILSPQRGSQTHVLSGMLVLVLAANHKAIMPWFKSSDS